MTELSKEYFDQQLKKLEKNLTDQNGELARMVNTGFEAADQQLTKIVEELDVRKELSTLKENFQSMKEKLEQALNVKL